MKVSVAYIHTIDAIYIEEIAAIWGNEVKVTHALVCSNAVYGGNKNLESGWKPQNYLDQNASSLLHGNKYFLE